jgi:hypothetical protein
MGTGNEQQSHYFPTLSLFPHLKKRKKRRELDYTLLKFILHLKKCGYKLDSRNLDLKDLKKKMFKLFNNLLKKIKKSNPHLNSSDYSSKIIFERNS